MPPAARTRLAALAAATLVAACAHGAGDGPASDTRGFGGSDAGGGTRESGGRADLNVFISPSGEPFHAGRREAYASAIWFARADSDHDGKLTRAEFQADADRAFALHDTDHDGVIDAFEIQHYEQEVAPEILPRIGGLRGGEGMDETLFKGDAGGGRRREGGEQTRDGRREIAGDRRAQGGGLYGVLAEPEPLTAADTDLSGAVSRAEWRARTDRRFDLLDTGGRGYLALADLPKTQTQLLLERRRAREAADARRAAPPR